MLRRRPSGASIFFRLLLALSFVTVSCASRPEPRPGERFWRELHSLCGRSFEGRMTEGTAPGDAAIGSERLVMHVASCSANEIRIPFHVGSDRSRTWVITRTDSGLRLKHDHRHEDGTEDRVSQYGGDARDPGDALSVDFPADAFTAALIPPSATNIWTLAIDPGKTFTYALRREGRRFRVEFDLR